MINEDNTEIPLTEENSAHVETPWNPDYKPDGKIFKDFYKFLTFPDNSHQTRITHIYPDWDIISDNLPNIKIILITFSPENIDEVAHNLVYKNNSENLELFYKQAKDTISNSLTDPSASPLEAHKFLSQSIPDSFVNRTLVLDYKNLFEKNNDGYFLTLERLEKFTGLQTPILVQESFKKYVEARNRKLIEIFG